MCINDLVAMTGNYDVPGGQIVARYAYNTSKKYGAGSEFISPELMDRRLGLDKNPILKSGFSPSISSDMAYAQMLSQDPYPIHFVWLEGTNPLSCCGCDTNRIYDAFKKVKYVVNHDVFMTPSSMALADLVLPAAMSVERQSFRSWWNPLRAITQCVDRYYESIGDDELVWYLGKHFNPDFFNQFETLDDFLTWMIQDEGNGVDYTIQDLRDRVYDYWDWDMTYKKYEKGMCRADGKPGFVTATGKYEFYSPLMDVIGSFPMPVYREPYESPVRTPEHAAEYPHLLTTGHRQLGFFHSEHRQLSYIRQFKYHEQPICDISPDIAEQHGIEDGDWIWIENSRGKCKQVARIAHGQGANLVRARHGWWFPEQDGEEPNLFGTFDCNINNLETQGVIGIVGFSAPVKGLMCKVYKVTPENDESVGEIVTRKGGFGGEHELDVRI